MPLIGARVAVLARLAAAPRTLGIGADSTGDATGVTAGELRGYGAGVFCRAVSEHRRAAVLDAFERAGAAAARVDGLAPVVPLLVAQIEQALDRGALPRRLGSLAVAGGAADVEMTSACRVRVTAYRLGLLGRGHVRDVFDGVLEPGRHRIALDPKAVRGRSFVVARTTGSVLVRPVDR